MSLQRECSEDELSVFIDKYLYKKYPKLIKQDANFYRGELLYIAYLAKAGWREDGAQFNTYLTTCFRNHMIKIRKKEKEWYDKHVVVSSLENYPSPTYNAALISQYNELIESIKETNLSPKNKEIVVHYLRSGKNLPEVGRHFGITKQRVSQIIESVRQYLLKRRIELG